MGDYFQGIKVGDRVWSVVFGWGEVKHIDNFCGVTFDSTPTQLFWFCWSGHPDGDKAMLQTLFWDEVKITPPPKPKRMVKKVAMGWLACTSALEQISHLPAALDCGLQLTWEEEE